MPTVRTYGTRQVSQNPLPGARLTPVDTPEAEGAGLARAQGEAAGIRGRAAIEVDNAVGALANTGERIGLVMTSRIAEQARRQADDTALLDAQNKLGAWKSSTLFDPESGAFVQKGKNSFGLPESVAESFNKTVGDIDTSLSTPEQKLAFRKYASGQWQSIDDQVRRHVANEIDGYRAGELKNLVGNSIDDAIRNAENPDVSEASLLTAEDAIKRNGKLTGAPAEAIDAQLRATRSSVRVGVISQYLALEKPAAARAYFEETKGDITADRLDDVKKALEEGGLREQSQTISDKLTAAGGTLTEQLAKMRDMDLDPKLRDQVEQRLEHNAALVERAQKEAEEGTMRKAFDVVDRTGDVTKIPASDWASFSGGTRASLISYADRKTRGVQPDTDYPTYYALLQQAAEDPTTFAQQNLLNYRGKLDDGAFKQMADLQMRLKAGDHKAADKELAGFRTKDQILNDTLGDYGIDAKAKPDSAEGKAIAHLRRLLDQRIEAAQADGKKVTNTEIQQALDGLLGQSVTSPGSWWGLNPFSSSHLRDQQKRLVDMDAADVPATERPGIERALRATGRPVTDATVLELYQNMLIRRNYRQGR